MEMDVVQTAKDRVKGIIETLMETGTWKGTLNPLEESLMRERISWKEQELNESEGGSSIHFSKTIDRQTRVKTWTYVPGQPRQVRASRPCQICGSLEHEADGDQIYDWQEDGQIPAACKAYMAEQKRLSQPEPTAEEKERAIQAEGARARGKLETWRRAQDLTGKLNPDRHEEGKVLWDSPHWIGREVVDWDDLDSKFNPRYCGYTLVRK